MQRWLPQLIKFTVTCDDKVQSRLLQLLEFTGKTDDKVQRRLLIVEFTGNCDDKVQRRLPKWDTETGGASCRRQQLTDWEKGGALQ